jgi:hypothetical protein
MERSKSPDPKTRKPSALRPRVIVGGSRTFTDYALLTRKLDRLLIKVVDPVVIHGGAKGADSLAGRWAEWNWYDQEIHHPDFETYGKSAGPIRNKAMVEAALSIAGRRKSVAIFFWDGKSPGTKQCIEYAKERGMTVRVIEVEV